MKKLIIIFVILLITVIKLPKSQEVRFTSYYPNDSTGSTNCTAIGYCTSDFKLNEEGFYTFQDKVVLATCVTSCTNSDEGICAAFTLPSHYKQYDFLDTIHMTIDGKAYEGIVLDICGACYWEEDHQRYDIYVEGKDSVIDKIGHVKEGISIRTHLLLVYIILGSLFILFMIFYRRIYGKSISRKKRRSIR